MSKPNPRYANGARRRALRARILARDDTCWLCGGLVDKTLPAGNPWAAEVHELIPVAQGGDPLDASNCVLTHRRHNQQIGNRTPEQLRRGDTGNQRPRRVIRPVVTSRKW